MMKGRLAVPIVSSIVVLMLSGAALLRDPEPPRDTLAVVAGQVITKEGFQSDYAGYLLKTGLPDTYPRRRAHLDNLIDLALIVRSLRDEGIEKDEVYRYEQEVVRRKLLIDAHLARVLFDTLSITNQDLREQFVRINTRLKARHLFARTSEEADVLYHRLVKGERFEDLAREVFTDTLLANNGGSIGFFGFDEMDPAFEDAAYRLAVGEVSQPVRTTSGYSIIQVEDRIEHPLLLESDFELKKGQLRTYVNRRKRTEALFEYSRHLTETVDPSFETKTLERLLALIRGEALISGPEDTWFEMPLVEFTIDGRRETWTVEDFQERARFTSDEQRARATSIEPLKSFITGLIVREIQLEQGQAAGYEASPEFQKARETALNEWMYREAWRRITQETVIPEDSLVAYFESNQEKFVVSEKVQVSEILLSRKSDADRVKALLDASSFEDLARTYSERPGADAAGGDLGFVNRQQLGRLADPVFDAVPGQILGPLEVNGKYVILQVGDRTPARPARFEEVRGDIISALKDRYAQVRFDEHVAGLRARYAVMVDESALASLTIPL